MVKFISEDMLLELKNNQNALFREVISGKSTLEDTFHSNRIIRETNVPGEDFELAMFSENPEDTDLENIKRVHKYMSGLSESQASDERIWTAYTLSVFSDYMRYRWPSRSETDMMNHYFFSYSAKRSLFRNGIARLWWIGHLTYDAGRDGDKYALTEYACRKQDNVNNLLDIDFGNNPMIVRASIQALMDSEKEGICADRDMVRDLSQYINTLGGIYLVDALSYDTVYNKSKERIRYQSVKNRS